MVLKLYPHNNDPRVLLQIVDTLNDGGVIIAPTDTTYALCCHALKERAVEHICKIKNIDPTKKLLSIICYDISQISEYAHVETATFKLMKRNLPGAFTFILQGTSRLPKIFRNRKEIGIRMPENEILQELTRLLEAPILSASLPLSEEVEAEYATDPGLVAELFGAQVELVVDGGIVTGGCSTIVDCKTHTATIIRQGHGQLQE